jgi:putative ABC transport system permease protein
VSERARGRRAFNFPWRTRRRIADDVDTELAFHLESRIRDLMAAGETHADAERRALREFGDIEDARRYMTSIDRATEQTHRRREHMRDLLQNARYALRRMRTAPVFTMTAVATLAIGIGANTAVFSVVDAALIRRLPYPNAERVVTIYDLASFGPFASSAANFLDYRNQSRSFDAAAAFFAYSRTVTGLGDPQSVPTTLVTDEFFKVLGVNAISGRLFGPEEQQVEDAKYAIISHSLWQRLFAGLSVVGRRVDIDGAGYSIVGVMPPGFSYPGRTDIWTPLVFDSEDLESQRGAHYLDVVALLTPGVTPAAADADVRAVAARLAKTFPNTNAKYSATAQPFREALIGATPKRALLVLFAAVALVALIACVNVANLVLARGTSRSRELAVRLALGASPRDLLSMALTESLLLALIGGLAGLFVAKGLSGVLDGLRPEGLREVGELQVSWVAAGFTLLVSMIAGTLFGLAPGMQAIRRTTVQPALSTGGRAGTGERRTHRLRSILVSAELALAVILLCGAGLLIKSFTRLQQVDTGFDARNILVVGLSMPDARYGATGKAVLAIEDVVRRVNAVPGVLRASGMNILPLDGGRYSISTRAVDGAVIPSADQPSTQIRVVTPGLFRTLDVGLRSGRDFTTGDRMGSTPVVIVNESAATLLWKGVDPIGHHVVISTRFTEDTARASGTVIGVISDIRDIALGTKPSPTIYFPHAQAPWSEMSIIARAAPRTDPLSLVKPLRREIGLVDPLLPLIRPRTMDDLLTRSVAQPRFSTLLMTVFASLAVLLAVIGVFGVMAYIVGERTREIGIRMALGASAQRVVQETLWRAAVPLLWGLILGLGGTVWLTRLMTRLLYDVKPTDPSVLGGVTFGLAIVALMAAYLPARRASSIDPLLALRAD